ncbi:MAG: ABC transporter ATP-binding protein [Gordonia sp. (in: high G+C Gram-positive bacteria)]
MGLCVRGFSVGYGKVDIVKSVDLTADRGKVIGVLGQNGSGKSTLIKSLAGIIRPSAGSAILDESIDLATVDRGRRATLVSYVPQQIELPFDLDVTEAVLLGRTPYFGTRPSAADWAHVAEAIEFLGLSDLAHRNVASISGGQAQRVLIARAIAQDGEILLLDEPTSALDIKYQWWIFRLARQIAISRHRVVVLAVHDLNLAGRACDEVIFLKDGRVVGSGPPAQTYSRALISDVYDVDVEIAIRDGAPEVRPSASALNAPRPTP